MAKKPRVFISFDYAIKFLLRNKANFEVLEGFLSELLKQDVKVRNIIESESNKTTPDDKQTKVDIMVENTKNELFIIELQVAMEFDYLYRMLYGVSKAVTEYMKQGDGYLNVRKIYAVHIVYFELGQGDDYVYHGTTTFRGMHKKDVLQLSQRQKEQLQKDTPGDLYPAYYILRVTSFGEKTRDTLDEWMHFLKTDEIKDSFTAKGLAKARKVLAREKMTAKERARYDAFQDERSHKLSMLTSAKDQGRAEFEPVIAKQKATIAA